MYPRHPDYRAIATEMNMWRNTLNGGNQYIDAYLAQYSTRESIADFNFRKTMTVNPALAEGAVTDIKNAIFQRFTEIRRLNGHKSYRQAIDGLKGGVDNLGSSMNTFIGNKVLIELIGMGKVGIYIEMPVLTGKSLADTAKAKPYLYIYRREEIVNWEYDNEGKLIYVVLQKQVITREKGVVSGVEYVEVKITNDTITTGDVVEENPLGVIPFVILELNHGILRDIAKYQIALMNISSSDINYLISANFPLYTEQVNQNTEIQNYMKGVDGEKEKGVDIGVKHGRSYPIGTDRPDFISPSAEPILASIKKQDQMKEELRQIVSLSVSTMRAKMESAESKKADQEGLESGLASVGTVLEAGERLIAKIWQKYVNGKEEVIITYPERYEIKDIDVTLARVEKMLKILPKIPVLEAQKKLMSDIIALLLSHGTDEDTLTKVIAKMNKLKIIVTDNDILTQDMDNGVISHELVAKLKHYPKADLKLAREEHINRLTAITIAQTPASDNNTGIRGNEDTQIENISREDKKNTNKRGEQKLSTEEK